MCHKIFPKIESTIYFVTVWTWRCHFCLGGLSNQPPAPCFKAVVLLPGLPLKGNDLTLFKIQEFHFILIIAWLFLLQIWHTDFRELKWEHNLKQWEFFSSCEYRISCSFSWLCSFTDCAVMFRIFSCSFETLRRMDRWRWSWGPPAAGKQRFLPRSSGWALPWSLAPLGTH